MAETTKADLTAIEARCNAATPGPWKAISANGHIYSTAIDDAVGAPHDAHGVLLGTMWFDANDAYFIAAAREDVPALIAMVRERDAEIERLKAAATERLQAQMGVRGTCAKCGQDVRLCDGVTEDEHGLMHLACRTLVSVDRERERAEKAESRLAEYALTIAALKTTRDEQRQVIERLAGTGRCDLVATVEQMNSLLCAIDLHCSHARDWMGRPRTPEGLDSVICEAAARAATLAATAANDLLELLGWPRLPKGGA